MPHSCLHRLVYLGRGIRSLVFVYRFMSVGFGPVPGAGIQPGLTHHGKHELDQMESLQRLDLDNF